MKEIPSVNARKCIFACILLIVSVGRAYGNINCEIREPLANDVASFLMMVFAIFGACMLMLHIRK